LHHAGARDTGSRSSRLFKKLHEARNREKNTEGKGPAQKASGKGGSGAGCSSSGGTATSTTCGNIDVEQMLNSEVPTLTEGPSATFPGPCQPVIKVKPGFLITPVFKTLIMLLML